VVNWRGQRLRESLKSAALPVVCFLAPVMASVLILMCLNSIWFGGPLSTSYGREATSFFGTKFFASNVRGLLVGSRCGILLYSPPLTIALCAFPLFARRHWKEASAIATGIVSIFLLYSFWAVAVTSNIIYGNRFLLPIVPLASVMLIPLLEKAGARHDAIRCSVVIALLAVGLLVQIPGVSVSVLNKSSWEAPNRFMAHATELLAGRHNLWWMGRAYSDFYDFGPDHLPEGFAPALPVQYPPSWIIIFPLAMIAASGGHLVLEARRVYVSGREGVEGCPTDGCT
jgi:hypothetical protein